LFEEKKVELTPEQSTTDEDKVAEDNSLDGTVDDNNLV